MNKNYFLPILILAVFAGFTAGFYFQNTQDTSPRSDGTTFQNTKDYEFTSNFEKSNDGNPAKYTFSYQCENTFSKVFAALPAEARKYNGQVGILYRHNPEMPFVPVIAQDIISIDVANRAEADSIEEKLTAAYQPAGQISHTDFYTRENNYFAGFKDESNLVMMYAQDNLRRVLIACGHASPSVERLVEDVEQIAQKVGKKDSVWSSNGIVEPVSYSGGRYTFRTSRLDSENPEVTTETWKVAGQGNWQSVAAE